MAIVKYTHKDGSQYAYSSLACWDPIRKQNRPVRKYLGKVDPSYTDIINMPTQSLDILTNKG